MFIKREARDSQKVSFLSLRVAALIAMAALPDSALVAGSLALSFMLHCVFTITRYSDFANDRLQSELWRDHLTLRFALDDVVIRNDEHLHIDWQSAAKHAADDIISATSADRAQGEFSGGTLLRFLFGLIEMFFSLLDFLLMAGLGMLAGALF
jgi:hypothetical protein